MATSPDNSPQLVDLGNFPTVIHQPLRFSSQYIQEFETARKQIKPTMTEWRSYHPSSGISCYAKIDRGYWPVSSFDNVIAPAVATLKHIHAHGPILELGCGNGDTALVLSHHLDSAVWGVDASNEAIDNFYTTKEKLPPRHSLITAANHVHLRHANMYPPGFHLLYSHEDTTQWINNLSRLEGKKAKPIKYGRQGFPKFSEFGIIYHYGYSGMECDVLRLVANYARNGAFFWLAGTGISNFDVTARYSQNTFRMKKAEEDKQRIRSLLEKPGFPVRLVSDQVDGNLFQVIRS